MKLNIYVSTKKDDFFYEFLLAYRRDDSHVLRIELFHYLPSFQLFNRALNLITFPLLPIVSG